MDNNPNSNVDVCCSIILFILIHISLSKQNLMFFFVKKIIFNSLINKINTIFSNYEKRICKTNKRKIITKY